MFYVMFYKTDVHWIKAFRWQMHACYCMHAFTFMVINFSFDHIYVKYHFKGTLRSETIWATKNPLKMMKNVFCFTSEALFALKIFKFLSCLFSHVSKWLDLKDQVDFKFYDITVLLANYFKTHIAQYLEK